MLRRVRIRGYKSLRDVEVRFDRPLSIIIGANASGKSNLFDALALLSRMVTRQTIQEAFEGHRGTVLEAFSSENNETESTSAKRFLDFWIEVDLEIKPAGIDAEPEEPPQAQQQWAAIPKNKESKHKNGVSKDKNNFGRFLRYSLEIQFDTAHGYLSIPHERLAALNADFTEKNEQSPIAERTGIQIRINAQDKAIFPGVYSAATSSTLFWQPLFLTHSPFITAQQEMKSWRFYDLEPKVIRQANSLLNVIALSSNGGDLAAFLNTMQVIRPKQFESIRRAFRLLVPQIASFDTVTFPDDTLHLRISEEGTTYYSRVISDGTLRVLALLAATNPLEPATLLGIEEPENGVHPRRLQLIASLLRNTAQEKGIQVLVNTHSPLLPRYFPEDDLIICRRIDGETVFEHLDTFSREPADIEQHLSDEGPTSITDRIVRGDYGG